MDVSASTMRPLDVKTDMLCYVTSTESDSVPEPEFPASVAAIARRCMDDLAGRRGRIVATATPLDNPPRILFAGLGSESGIAADTLRDVAGTISRRAQEMGVKRFAVVCPDMNNSADAASQITEGCVLALYDFDQFRSKKAEPAPNLTVVCRPEVAESVHTAKIAAEGVLFARNLANLPANQCSPAKLAEFAEEISSESDRKGGDGKRGSIKCTILSGRQLSEGGFGGINAVGQGSANTPRLITLEYGGGRGPPVVLVGKAVTFDTGGISIKPGERMDEMKFDKCGGCTVLAVVRTAARLGLPVNLVGVVPSVENMPGGGSYRPGDIIKLYGGKTAEILNTDAEGRLILADALSYAEERFSPKCMIDLATLTGACIIALGCDVAGMISNDDNLASDITKSGGRTAEPVWRLPLDADYMDMIKSKVADIKNLVPGKAAGTVAAAAFLRSAVQETPWLHLDIAGTAWMQPPSKKRSYNPPGATGFGVRLLLDYLRNASKD